MNICACCMMQRSCVVCPYCARWVCDQCALYSTCTDCVDLAVVHMVSTDATRAYLCTHYHRLTFAQWCALVPEEDIRSKIRAALGVTLAS